MAAVHPRQAIREAAKAQLIGPSPHRTIALDRVVASRRIPWRPKDLPAIAVYVLEEDVDPDSAQTAPRELQREPKLVIEAILRADVDNIDDALDAIALEIETAMAIDETLGGTVGDSWLRRTEFEFGMEGDQEIASIRLIHDVVYHTFRPDGDDQTFDDLRTVDAKYNLGNAQEAANRANDRLEDLDE